MWRQLQVARDEAPHLWSSHVEMDFVTDRLLHHHPLCRSSCRGAHLLIQPWICRPEIDLANKTLNIGGWVTLIISANDTLTVARATAEWWLYHMQLSKADSVCLALSWAAAFCWVPPEMWCGNVAQPIWKCVVHWCNVPHFNSLNPRWER